MEQKSRPDRQSTEWKKYLSRIRTQAARKGGLTTALKHCATDPDFAKTRAAQGGVAVLARYGRDYFQFLSKRTKNTGWPKGKSRKLTRRPFPLKSTNNLVSELTPAEVRP